MKLELNTLKPGASTKKGKIKGRGNASGAGNYSGHGGKGQTARSGVSGLKQKGFKRILQSTPKLRGFKSFKQRPIEITLSVLEENFSEGEVVNLKSLLEKKLVKKDESAKVLKTGDLKKKLVIEEIACTKGAKAVIEKLGGEVK